MNQASFGLGLRPTHYESILSQKPRVDFFEIITENFLVPGGMPWHYLERIRADYPLVMHGVSLSIGGEDPLDWEYIRQISALSHRIDAMWISDHLCWTGVNGVNTHDLLPVIFDEQSLNHIVNRIIQIQDFLRRRILIENVSSYLNFKQSSFTEWKFIGEIAERADCYILLDVNNIYVNANNHGFCPYDYINALPPTRIKQIHLAGHSRQNQLIIDTHDQPIIDTVWELYEHAIKKFGFIATMIERDDNIPPLNVLLNELGIAKKIAHSILCSEVA